MNELLLLALVGGLLTLDETSVGQFMVSRPLVAGALTGWLVGEPVMGFWIGALLEIYLLVEFPTGGAALPEGAPAAVVAVASAAVAPGPGGEAVGIAVALVWGQLGGMSVSRLRRFNAELAPDESGGSVSPAALVRAHVTGLVLDFARGVLVTLSGLLLGRWMVGTFSGLWPLDEAATRSLLLLGGIVSVGILLESFGGLRKRRLVFGLGAAAGLGLGWLL